VAMDVTMDCGAARVNVVGGQGRIGWDTEDGVRLHN